MKLMDYNFDRAKMRELLGHMKYVRLENAWEYYGPRVFDGTDQSWLKHHDETGMIAIGKEGFLLLSKDFRAPVCISIQCRNCKKTHGLIVDKEDLQNYKEDQMNIQTAFPYLKPSERELIMTQTCDDCWKELFNGAEE